MPHTVIAQLSDPHITRRGARICAGQVDSNTALARAIEAVERLSPVPDLVLVTGDLVENGEAAEYEVLRELLASLRPRVIVLPGNHDRRAPLRAVLAGVTVWDDFGFSQGLVDLGDLKVLILDSVDEGHCAPQYCPARLQWLLSVLAKERSPLLVAFHHPPILSGIAMMDDGGVGWSGPLINALRGHGKVLRICGGHLHRSIFSSIDGLSVSVCPSTSHQLTLDFSPIAPRARAFIHEPRSFHVHSWDGNAFTTHVSTVDASPHFDAFGEPPV
jgi:Icc protein